MPWQKGQSGNPGGRPKGCNGMVRALRRETRDGEELAEFALALFRGEPIGPLNEVPTLKMRADAMAWIADRVWGKPKQEHELTHNESAPTLALEDLPDDQLEQMLNILSGAMLDANGYPVRPQLVDTVSVEHDGEDIE